MRLYRLALQSRTPWCTPWQADTLFGLLCWTSARDDGPERVSEELITPALEGSPPFVLSDACPGDFLPVPARLRAQSQPWSPADRKKIRKARWITREGFRLAQLGQLPPADTLDRSGGVVETADLHNMISRQTNTTSEGGRLFATPTFSLGTDNRLSIYARIKDGFEGRFVQLFKSLSTRGFGADASVGRGDFEVASDELVADPELDDVEAPNALTVVSTFQPGAEDPTDGYWESFVKYGKLGPDFGVDNVFKRPLLVLRPGAFFWKHPFQPILGRAIPMDQLLSTTVRTALEARSVKVIHPAFGLALPMRVSERP